jgi:hypothetical protein
MLFASENLASLFPQATKYFKQCSIVPHSTAAFNMLLRYGSDEKSYELELV